MGFLPLQVPHSCTLQWDKICTHGDSLDFVYHNLCGFFICKTHHSCSHHKVNNKKANNAKYPALLVLLE
ncbi:hypothetical protein O6P43_010576 [Quillaja saponaria]|uniref:Uncharacterized protein n=1 Tax=Quillaja saponaria TaxID=32244 RepID=A0AAD7VEN6_QUISA|nr:hypothetical protein O6P43_010576 [Quillaja saponaria]